MTPEEIKTLFAPVLEQVMESCALTDHLADKEMFQIHMATIWGNSVLEPSMAGIEESDLESLHDYLNITIEKMVGKGATMTRCFEFIESDEGQAAMDRFQLTKRHKDFLNHFTGLILATRDY